MKGLLHGLGKTNIMKCVEIFTLFMSLAFTLLLCFIYYIIWTRGSAWVGEDNIAIRIFETILLPITVVGLSIMLYKKVIKR